MILLRIIKGTALKSCCLKKKNTTYMSRFQPHTMVIVEVHIRTYVASGSARLVKFQSAWS